MNKMKKQASSQASSPGCFTQLGVVVVGMRAYMPPRWLKIHTRSGLRSGDHFGLGMVAGYWHACRDGWIRYDS